jgi:hypothetical protein
MKCAIGKCTVMNVTSRDSSVGIALDYGLDDRRGLGIFLFTTASRTALEPTQPPIQWVPGAISLGLKRPGREADHSPPRSAEVKEWVELYLHSHITPSWRGAQLSTGTTLPFTFYLLTVINVTTIFNIEHMEKKYSLYAEFSRSAAAA